MAGIVARQFAWLAAFAIAGLAAVGPLSAAELIYQEGFNDDGELAVPPRWTSTGRYASEFPHDPAFVTPNTSDQVGPVFWGLNSEVSLVGVYGPTAERRALLVWDGAITADEVSPDLWTLVDGTLDWLLRGKQNATIVFTVSQTNAQSLADHFIALGHTVVDDDTSQPDTAIAGDLIIKTSNSASPGRFSRVAKPVLTFSATDHDDMLTSTIGTATTFAAYRGAIVDASHPVAGGLTGSFAVPTNSHTWQLIGDELPSGAITIANLIRQVPPAIPNLAAVDALVSGSEPSAQFPTNVTVVDFSDGAGGDWFWDNSIPGGVTNTWGLVAKGKINVASSGTYSFAITANDGARLRIDKDANGFSDADNLIVDDTQGAIGTTYGDLQLNAGTYDFEITAFNTSGAGALEMSVSLNVGGGDTNAISGGTWELLGQTGGAVSLLNGTVQATAYVPTAPPDEVAVPMLALLNGPNDTPAGSVYGGGPFSGYEGTGFFGGAALSKFDVDLTGPTKTLTLQPIDVTGKQNVKLTIACAATFLDFDTNPLDFLDVMINTNNSGTNFIQLIHFRAPNGATKYFDDRSTHPSNPTRLGLVFKDVTYDIPPETTILRVRVDMYTTWYNEIAAFDNIRITAGDVVAALSLDGAADVNGVFAPESSAVIDTNAKTITVPLTSGNRFYRGNGQAVRFTGATIQGNNLVITYE